MIITIVVIPLIITSPWEGEAAAEVKFLAGIDSVVSVPLAMFTRNGSGVLSYRRIKSIRNCIDKAEVGPVIYINRFFYLCCGRVCGKDKGHHSGQHDQRKDNRE